MKLLFLAAVAATGASATTLTYNLTSAGWTPGDLLIWDNTGVLHRAEPYPLDSGRVMRRTTLMGEEPFA